mgnify:CR=1 FL=1
MYPNLRFLTSVYINTIRIEQCCRPILLKVSEVLISLVAVQSFYLELNIVCLRVIETHILESTSSGQASHRIIRTEEKVVDSCADPNRCRNCFILVYISVYTQIDIIECLS